MEGEGKTNIHSASIYHEVHTQKQTPSLAAFQRFLSCFFFFLPQVSRQSWALGTFLGVCLCVPVCMWFRNFSWYVKVHKKKRRRSTGVDVQWCCYFWRRIDCGGGGRLECPAKIRNVCGTWPLEAVAGYLTDRKKKKNTSLSAPPITRQRRSHVLVFGWCSLLCDQSQKHALNGIK